MHGAGHQLFAGATLSRKQDGRISRRDFGNELVHLAHRLAFTDHVVLEPRVCPQPLIFVLKRFKVARIFDRDGGDARDRAHQLQMIVVELSGRFARVQINDSQSAVKHYQRHTQKRAGRRGNQTLGRFCSFTFARVVAEQGHAFFQHLLRNGPAYLDRIVKLAVSVHPNHRSEFTRLLVCQQNGAAFGGDHFEQEFQ